MKPKKECRKRKRWKSELRLLLICIEVFILVVAVGVAVLLYREDEKQMDKQQEHADVVPEVSVETNAAPKVKSYNNEEKDDSRYGAILQDADYCKEHRIYAKDTISDEEVVLAFAGDVSFAEGYTNMHILKQRGNDIRNCFDEELLEIMQNADVFMVNNEFPYTDRGTPTEGKTYTFRANPQSVQYLYDIGVDIVSIANNHVYDYGEVSLLDTMTTLENAKMPYVGAGRNKKDAIKPVYFVANDLKIAYLSATQIERLDHPDTVGATDALPGVFRCWNDDTIADSVRAAKEESDFVVVYVHWGTEMEDSPDWAQLELAKKLAKAGADLIIGDHPHCLQEIAYVDGVPVIYSLGNYWFNSKTMDTCIVKAVLTKEGLANLRFLPARQENCRTRLLAGKEAQDVISYMNTLSDTALIDEKGYLKMR